MTQGKIISFRTREAFNTVVETDHVCAMLVAECKATAIKDIMAHGQLTPDRIKRHTLVLMGEMSLELLATSPRDCVGLALQSRFIEGIKDFPDLYVQGAVYVPAPEVRTLSPT